MSKDDLSLAALQAAQYRAMFDDNPRAMLVYEHATLQIMAANQAAHRCNRADVAAPDRDRHEGRLTDQEGHRGKHEKDVEHFEDEHVAVFLPD